MSTDSENYDPKEDPASEWNRSTVSDKPYHFIRDETYRSRRNLILMSSLVLVVWWLELSPSRLKGFLVDLSGTQESKFYLTLWIISSYEAVAFVWRFKNDRNVWMDSTIYITHNSIIFGRNDANTEFTILEHGKKAVTTFGGDGFKNNQYWQAMYRGLVNYYSKKLVLQKKQKLFVWGWEFGLPCALFLGATCVTLLKNFPIERGV